MAPPSAEQDACEALAYNTPPLWLQPGVPCAEQAALLEGFELYGLLGSLDALQPGESARAPPALEAGARMERSQGERARLDAASLAAAVAFFGDRCGAGAVGWKK
jgi:hypothetical protein